MKMDQLSLSAALFILLNIQAAGAQGSDTTSLFQRRPVFCLEPPYKGPGKAVLPRFFFNTKSGLCEAFVFGGGRAKLNNFRTKDECTRVCSWKNPVFESQEEVEDEYQSQLPECQRLELENQDQPEAEKPEDYDIELDNEDEDEDYDQDEDDEDEDEVNDEGWNEEHPQD